MTIESPINVTSRDEAITSNQTLNVDSTSSCGYFHYAISRPFTCPTGLLSAPNIPRAARPQSAIASDLHIRASDSCRSTSAKANCIVIGTVMHSTSLPSSRHETVDRIVMALFIIIYYLLSQLRHLSSITAILTGELQAEADQVYGKKKMYKEIRKLQDP
jgi:hypothetical protein